MLDEGSLHLFWIVLPCSPTSSNKTLTTIAPRTIKTRPREQMKTERANLPGYLSVKNEIKYLPRPYHTISPVHLPPSSPIPFRGYTTEKLVKTPRPAPCTCSPFRRSHSPCTPDHFHLCPPQDLSPIHHTNDLLRQSFNHVHPTTPRPEEKAPRARCMSSKSVVRVASSCCKSLPRHLQEVSSNTSHGSETGTGTSSDVVSRTSEGSVDGFSAGGNWSNWGNGGTGPRSPGRGVGDWSGAHDDRARRPALPISPGGGGAGCSALDTGAGPAIPLIPGS